MDVQSFLIGIEAFRRGEARPLLMPGSMQSELTINLCFEEVRREWEAENGRNVGYPFPWGQTDYRRESRNSNLPGFDVTTDAVVVQLGVGLFGPGPSRP